VASRFYLVSRFYLKYVKAIGMLPFKVDIGYISWLPLDLLAPSPQVSGSESDESYAEKMAKILRMFWESMEEAQLTITTEANKKRQAYPFSVGYKEFLDTRLLPIGDTNVTRIVNNCNNSCKFQHLYAGPFTLLRKTGENAFVLDFPAHWRLHSVFNVSRLKLFKVDRSCEHPPPPPLHSTATAAEYKVESILEHQGTTARNLEYLVKWVGYTGATWELPVNLKSSSNKILGEYHAANVLHVYQWMG